MVPGPLASLMLMRRRRGGGRGAGRGRAGVPFPDAPGLETLERGLGEKRVLVKPLRTDALWEERAVCSPRSRPVLGPAGFAPAFSPSPEGRSAAAPHRPRWRGGRRGLQISASAWISALSRQRAPEVSGACVHQFSQLKRGAAIGGGPAGIPQPFLWPHPLAPSTPGKGGGDAETAGPGSDRPALRENVTAENSGL